MKRLPKYTPAEVRNDPYLSLIHILDHHIVADVDTHMADTGGIIRSGEKHQIARFDIGRGYGLSLIHI